MSFTKKLGFLFAFVLPSLIVFGYYQGGYWTYSNFIFAYGMVPFIDYFIGKDPKNVKKEDLPILAGEIYFELVLHVLAYVQVGIVAWSCYVVATGDLTLVEVVGMTLSVMTLGGGAINIAHELGHKPSKIAQFHSQMILMTVCYMHFFIEHNRGHHVNIGTPHDPATSKKGQTFYQFWVQTVVGSWKSAWKLEERRLERRNIAVISTQNMMLWYVILPIVFCSILTLGYSLYAQQVLWAVPLFFIAQSFLAFSSLEAVNYIEHYGLVRKEIAPNKYERVNPLHSWNSNYMVSNFLLFQLQRHSDHHAFAARPYQILRHFDESPQLPAGLPNHDLDVISSSIIFSCDE